MKEGAGPSRRAGGPVQARVRLGVILPSVNTVVEPWFNQVLPSGCALHATRMLLSDNVTPESLRRMDHEEGMAAAQRLASCRPHAMAYCCTASSVIQGLAYDDALRRTLEEKTGIPCFTAVGAILEALAQFPVRKLAIASPYTDVIDHREVEIFSAAGFEVVGSANLGIADGFSLASPTRDDMLAVARRAWRADADALLVSCLNMNSQEVVAELEAELGKPVITSTTATLWKLLQTAGLRPGLVGWGRLLAGETRAAAATLTGRSAS